MNKFRLAFLAFVVVSTCFIAFLPMGVKASREKIKMLELTQAHCALGGLKVQFSPDAVRILLLKNHSVIVARAPGWRVICYRPATKQFFDYPFEKWKVIGPTLSLAGDAIQGNVLEGVFVKQKEYKLDGERVLHLVSNNGRACEYSVIKAPKGSEKACTILESFLRTPRLTAIPVSFNIASIQIPISQQKGFGAGWVETRAKSSNLIGGYRLMTASIKQVTVASSDLEIPKDYKRANNEAEIWLTPESKSAIGDLLNMSGLDKVDRHK
jgi:hypothetical protein